MCPPTSRVAVGSVEPIPTELTPTESTVVMIVPPTPTFNTFVVIIPALTKPVVELISKLDAVTIPETNMLLTVRIPLMFALP